MVLSQRIRKDSTFFGQQFGLLKSLSCRKPLSTQRTTFLFMALHLPPGFGVHSAKPLGLWPACPPASTPRTTDSRCGPTRTWNLPHLPPRCCCSWWLIDFSCHYSRLRSRRSPIYIAVTKYGDMPMCPVSNDAQKSAAGRQTPGSGSRISTGTEGLAGHSRSAHPSGSLMLAARYIGPFEVEKVINPVHLNLKRPAL